MIQNTRLQEAVDPPIPSHADHRLVLAVKHCLELQFYIFEDQ
jgi:hypothetical protein